MFLKFLAYGLLAYIVYLIVRFFSAIKKSQIPSVPKQRSSGIMVKDNTCNTYLPKEEAIREMYQGQEYFFCSQACRKKFLESKKPH